MANHAEHCCREHRHEPDSKHFAHLGFWPQIRRFCHMIGSGAEASITRTSYLSPPRSWCARKNSAEPAVAIAAEAEISSASVAAATICAKR
jgi:hypothetical protein